MTELWWGTRQKPSPRFMIDIGAMKFAFNTKSFTLFKQEVSWDTDFVISTTSLELLTDTEQPKWIVKFRMLKDTKLPAKIEFNDEAILTIQYQENQIIAPVADYVYPEVVKSQHNIGGHNLCLHHGGARNGWDPAKSTVGTIAQWSVQWLRAWMYWTKYNEWPEAS